MVFDSPQVGDDHCVAVEMIERYETELFVKKTIVKFYSPTEGAALSHARNIFNNS